MVGKDEHDQGPSESRVASRLYFTTAVSSHGSLCRGPSTVALILARQTYFLYI